MKRYAFAVVVLAHLLGLSHRGLAADPRSGEWTVKLGGERACSGCPSGKAFDFEAGRLGAAKVVSFAVTNEMSRVLSVHAYGSSAVILGEMGSNGQIVTVWDLTARKNTERFFGYSVALSPDGRYAAFKRFYPRHAPDEVVSDVVMVYDFGQPPSANRAKDKKETNPENVGIPLFPRANAEANEVRPLTAKGHFFVSNLSWSSSGNVLGFVAEAARLSEMQTKGYRAKTYSVVGVNLFGGVAKRAAFVRRVTPSDFLKPGSKGAPKEARPIRKISIADDGIVDLETERSEKLKPSVSLKIFAEPDEKY